MEKLKHFLLDDDLAIQQFVEPESNEQPRDRSPEAKSARRVILIRATLGEFLATFLFFFSVCGVKLNEANDPNASAIGCIGTALSAVAIIYSFADISGAHFNPAVTFACWLTKKTSNRKFILFVFSQILGGIFSMLALMLCFDKSLDSLAIEPPKNESLGRVFFMECVLTFILVFVIFTVAFENLEAKKKVQTFKGQAGAYGLTLYTASPQSKTGFAPIAIGFTIGFLSLIGGTVSGGAYNPARVFSAAIVTNKWENQWVYWLADFLGAAIAAGVSTLFGRFGVSLNNIPSRGSAMSVAPGSAQMSALPQSYQPPNPKLSTVSTSELP